MGGCDTRPSDILKSEHQTILRVLTVLETLVGRAEPDAQMEIEALRQCVTFFRLFADRCHHAKEEDLLFPALEERGIPRDGGPIGVMIYEHTVARGLVAEMDSMLEEESPSDVVRDRFAVTATKYVDLLRDHINKEDNCLFPMGDQALKSTDQESLCAKFCEVGCRAFEGHTKDELENLADALESRWLASADE